MPAKT